MTMRRAVTLGALLVVSCVPRFEDGIWCNDDERCPQSLVCRCSRCIAPTAPLPMGCVLDGGTGGGTAGGTGGGTAGGTACVPRTCQALNATCGAADDGCGTPLNCGVCQGQQVCSMFRCLEDVSLSQVLAVQAATPDDGGVAQVSLPVTNVTVTAVKPAVLGAAMSDGPGFFVQAQDKGLFVEASVARQPLVGDSVSFTATRVARINGHRRVLEVTGFSRLAGDGGLPGLWQVETFDQNFLRAQAESALGVHDTMLTSVVAPDAGYVVAETDGGRAWIRLPVSVNDVEDLRPGCTVRANGPIWLTPDAVHVDAYARAALERVQCPPPLLVSAVANSGRQVRVTTSRRLDPATALPGRFQIREVDSPTIAFTITGVQERSRDVWELTTSTPFRSGFEYEVGVGPMPPTDLKGVPVPASSRAAFLESTCFSRARVVISAVSVFTTDGEWVELHNRTAAPLPVGGWVLGVRTLLNTRTFDLPPGTTMAPGAYLLVQLNTRSNSFSVPPDVVASTLSLQPQGSVVFVGPPRTAACDDALVEDRLAFGNALLGCADMPQPSTPTSGQMLRRADGRGCVDTASNTANFSQVPLAPPRTASSRATTCLCP
ncbi:MAG: lamin tail domain-containing protein [Myxococcaceae bacterium]|nr:lamin tail domain-containing protein [Myxococcaceae bacterium]